MVTTPKTEREMYDALTEFLRTFNTAYPLLWALFVMGVVACTGLGLYFFWEGVLRLFSGKNTQEDGQPRSHG